MKKIDIRNLEEGELLTINEFREIYDELDPSVDGDGIFIASSTWLTEDEVTYDKVFDGRYISDNKYTHIIWYAA